MTAHSLLVLMQVGLEKLASSAQQVEGMQVSFSSRTRAQPPTVA